MQPGFGRNTNVGLLFPQALWLLSTPVAFITTVSLFCGPLPPRLRAWNVQSLRTIKELKCKRNVTEHVGTSCQHTGIFRTLFHAQHFINYIFVNPTLFGHRRNILRNKSRLSRWRPPQASYDKHRHWNCFQTRWMEEFQKKVNISWDQRSVDATKLLKIFNYIYMLSITDFDTKGTISKVRV